MGKLILPEVAKIVEALNPATDAAGRAGAYVTLKDAPRCYVIAHIAQGASSTVKLSIQQAQDVEGTGAKTITNAVPIWANLDTSASDSLDRKTDDVSYTTSASLKNKVVVFQVDAASLDTNNGFNSIVVSTGASSASNITSAMYVLTDIRFQSSDTPSAIVD